MEELELAEPVVEPEKVTSAYKVRGLQMDLLGHMMPDGSLSGLVIIILRDNLDNHFTHRYEGQQAVDYMKFINTANFSVKSLNRRILERLSTEGVLPGTVTGAPDPLKVQD